MPSCPSAALRGAKRPGRGSCPGNRPPHLILLPPALLWSRRVLLTENVTRLFLTTSAFQEHLFSITCSTRSVRLVSARRARGGDFCSPPARGCWPSWKRSPSASGSTRRSAPQDAAVRVRDKMGIQFSASIGRTVWALAGEVGDRTVSFLAFFLVCFPCCGVGGQLGLHSSTGPSLLSVPVYSRSATWLLLR